MAINLSAQRKEFRLVIGYEYLKSNFDLDSCLTDLTNYGFNYFSSIHDKDKNSDGSPKFKHIHLVLINSKRLRAKQVLNYVSDCFNCSNENIQIMECPNVPSAVQYLIHKNNPEKYQYDVDIIKSNVDNDLLNGLLNTDLSYKEVTTESLLEILSTCNSRIEIIRRIGIGSYSNYRQTINDILNELGIKL